MIFKKIGFKFIILTLFLFNISFAEIIKTSDFEIKGNDSTVSLMEFNTIVDILRNWFFDNVTGYMGLGTDTPDAKLDVAGQVKISGGSPGIGKVLTSDATGLATWEDTAISSQWNNISGGINYADGNVGIGTTDLEAKLEVNGAIKIGDMTVTEAKKGMIRYISALDDFCGYDDTEWISLTGKSSCIVCTVSSWAPSTNSVCSGTTFTQTSNCSTTRSATGTKNCSPICDNNGICDAVSGDETNANCPNDCIAFTTSSEYNSPHAPTACPPGYHFASHTEISSNTMKSEVGIGWMKPDGDSSCFTNCSRSPDNLDGDCVGWTTAYDAGYDKGCSGKIHGYGKLFSESCYYCNMQRKVWCISD